MIKLNYLTIRILVFLLFVFYAESIIAQTEKQTFDESLKYQVSEKIFVHTDKSFYVTNERLWFKVYNVAGLQNEPSILSKVAYLEILNDQNEPIIQTKISLNNGVGDGSILLTSEITSGNYSLRCYTNWMKNFDAELFFSKKIQIINTINNEEINPVFEVFHSKYDVQFFPEGGDLIHNLKSKVAFKITDEFAKGKGGSGAIVNNLGDTVVTFKTLKYGIGSFYLIPDKNQEYTAKIKLDNGNVITSQLPKIKDEGYVMHLIDNSVDNLSLQINKSFNKSQDIVLLVYSGEKVLYVTKQSIEDHDLNIQIPKLNLVDGISNIVLLVDGLPIAERLYFKKPVRTLDISAKFNKISFDKREKAIIDFTSFNSNLPVKANLSFSVYELNELQKADSLDIYSYLWLSSELKGYIESPSYYFHDNINDQKEATDNLMLSHGWRKFKNPTSQAKPFIHLPEIEAPLIFAKVIDLNTKEGLKNVNVMLASLTDPLLFYEGKSDTTGRIIFNSDFFYGKNELVLQPISNDSLLRVEIQNPFSESYIEEPLLPLNIDQRLLDKLNKQNINSQIHHLYRGDDYFKPSVNPERTNFYQKADKSYNLSDYNNFPTVEEVFREYIFEVSPRKHNDKFILRSLYVDKGVYFEENPLLLYDGIPVFETGKFMKLDPRKLERIEVVASKYYIGSSALNGIVSLTSRDKNFDRSLFNKNALIIDFEGLQQRKDFYSPAYDLANMHSRIPDFRNLLHWSPQVKTDKNGKANLVINTPDNAGKFIVVLQGMDQEGNVSSYSTSIEVK
jgi:hypothetical protein